MKVITNLFQDFYPPRLHIPIRCAVRYRNIRSHFGTPETLPGRVLLRQAHSVPFRKIILPQRIPWYYFMDFITFCTMHPNEAGYVFRRILSFDHEATVRQMVAEQTDMKIPSELIPKCPVCGAPMAINLRCDMTFCRTMAGMRLPIVMMISSGGIKIFIFYFWSWAWVPTPRLSSKILFGGWLPRIRKRWNLEKCFQNHTAEY